MKYEIGKQYKKDNSFKKKARLHQSEFRNDILQVDFDEYGNRLTKPDAKAGLNFYKGYDIFDAVKNRYENYSKGLYADMLRSEHIPFNIFIPLSKNTELAKSIFNNFLAIKINEVISIKIECAPSPSEEYLNDRTAFDVFVEYKNIQNEFGIIGIEVKYTELDYKLKDNSKEKDDIEKKDSVYFQVTNSIGLYKPEKISELPKDKYRQMWRNHLLGESILSHKNSKYSEFISVLLYPKGNLHFANVTEEYSNLLLSNKKNCFISITFESFFELIEKYAITKETNKWLQYLRTRYLF